MIGILITSHPGHRKIGLNRCVESVKEYRGPVVLGWDDVDYRRLPKGVFPVAEVFLTARSTKGMKPGRAADTGEHMQFRLGVLRLKGRCEYMLKICGDMFFHQEAFNVFSDLISARMGHPTDKYRFYTWPHDGGSFGTKACFGRVKDFERLVYGRDTLTYTVESAYAGVAKKLGLTYREMPREWWLRYVGGRC